MIELRGAMICMSHNSPLNLLPENVLVMHPRIKNIP